MSPAPKKQTSLAQNLQKRIPTYAADGSRLHGYRMRDYALSAIERLLKLSRVVVRRNRKGCIVSAQFRPECGANPLCATALAGTRYSFLEQICEYRVWSHRRLIPRQDLEQMAGQPLAREDAERFVQSIFCAVPLSCIHP